MRALKIVVRVALVILITLVVLEGALRLFAPRLPGQIGVIARYVTTGQPFSEDWTPAWRENRDHYYTLRPGISDALQYGSPSVSFQLTTNKLWDDGLPADEGIGFRTAPVDFAVDATVVGDSFGFCFTEQDDCWVDIWARSAGINIVNLSTPVTGSVSHARMIQDFAAPLEPPLVVWQFFGNDFYDDYVLHVWRGDIESLNSDTADEQHGSWIARQTVVGALAELLTTGTWSGLPAGEKAYQAQFRAPYPGGLLEFGKSYELTALDMSRPENEYGYEQTRQALEEAKAAVEAWGGELVVVIIPTREEVYSEITGPVMGADKLETLESARLAMLDLCAEIAMDCLDPTDELSMRAQNAALYYADDMHLNAAGNTALAEILQRWLEAIRDSV
jgi:lysophospholipase L1-like esterase